MLSDVGASKAVEHETGPSFPNPPTQKCSSFKTFASLLNLYRKSDQMQLLPNLNHQTLTFVEKIGCLVWIGQPQSRTQHKTKLLAAELWVM